MAVVTACYCSREDVMRAIDFKDSLITNQQIDRGIQSAARVIEGQCQRIFYPIDATYKWDWPNYNYSYPWRLWVDQWDIVTLTQVQSPPGTTISPGSVILYPFNKKPGHPYTRVELDRSTTAAWGAAATPQLSIALTGTFGFTADMDAVTTLTAAISSTSVTTLAVADSSQTGVGDLLIIDTERLLVSGKTFVSTGITFTAPATASAGDNVIPVPDGTQFAIGEVLLFDSERMLVMDIVGNNLTVKRAWDGTVLAAHTSGLIYAPRQLTVLRGQFGTTAATHLNAATVNRHRPPSLVKDLAIAESTNRVLQETGGYARVENEGAAAHPAPGAGLADLWDEVVQAYGRKGRIRAI